MHLYLKTKAMSHVKNYVHCVWGTKARYPFFNETNTRDIMMHIQANARDHEIWIDHVNANQDHIHCLISLGQDQTLADVINQIKGESSHWINQTIPMARKFSWAANYYASSVSIKMIPVVRQYIQNQVIHHSTKTWAQEEHDYQMMISKLLKPFQWGR
jgi:putative transposase